jgi:hypothetical protein
MVPQATCISPTAMLFRPTLVSRSVNDGFPIWPKEALESPAASRAPNALSASCNCVDELFDEAQLWRDG